jgi:hypothetical protein
VSRQLVERGFPDGLGMPSRYDGMKPVDGVANTSDRRVASVRWCDTTDKQRALSIDQAPDRESISEVAATHGCRSMPSPKRASRTRTSPSESAGHRDGGKDSN